MGKTPGEHEGAGVRGVLSTSAGRLKAQETLDRIADVWPLDSVKVKEKLAEWVQLDPELSRVILNECALDVYAMKVIGEPSLRFTPSVLRED